MNAIESRNSSKGSLPGLVLWFVVVFCVAAMGALFMPGPWYAGLKKPSWTPPGAVFGPVWTALYIMMAIAAWRVWRKGGFAQQSFALNLFIAQLLLNAAWTPLCFGLHNLLLSSVDIVALWVVLALTIRAFLKVDRPAGWLLAPYLAWVTCASTLNIGLYVLN